MLDHDETFYGINTKVPSNYNLQKWIEIGVDSKMIDVRIYSWEGVIVVIFIKNRNI